MTSYQIQNGGRNLSTGSLNLFLSELKQGITVTANLASYQDNPAAFVHDFIDFSSVRGDGPTFYQDEILEEFPVRRRVAVRGPHGLGKTAIMSWVAIWGVMVFPLIKIPCLASKWRQLTKFLFPEIHKWATRLRWDKLGRDPLTRYELLSLSLRLSRNREAFALTSDEPEAIEGAHEDRMIYVFDESKAIPDPIWDAAEGAMASGETYWLACSTPGEPVGRFYDIHARAPGTEDWWARHVTIDEAIKAGRVDSNWVDARRRQWGEGSAVYQNRVLGEFAKASADDVVIPLSWVEAAVDRWNEWHDDESNWVEIDGDPVPIDEEGKVQALTSIGIDVGRGGDKSILAPRIRTLLPYLRKVSGKDTMRIVGDTIRQIRRYGGSGVPIVDVIGVGAGVVDRLREQVGAEGGLPSDLVVQSFNAAGKTNRRDTSGELEFLNVRAAAWWGMRELLDPETGDDIMLPPDDELIGELVAPRWAITSAGKVKIESKDDIRKRIGKSTDHADAVVQSFFGPFLEGDLFY